MGGGGRRERGRKGLDGLLEWRAHDAALVSAKRGHASSVDVGVVVAAALLAFPLPPLPATRHGDGGVIERRLAVLVVAGGLSACSRLPRRRHCQVSVQGRQRFGQVRPWIVGLSFSPCFPCLFFSLFLPTKRESFTQEKKGEREDAVCNQVQLGMSKN